MFDTSDKPVMQTREVRLRPIADADRPFLYRIMTSPDSGGRVRFAGATPSPERVWASIWESVLAQFVMERTRTGEPCGLVAITTPNFRDGFAYISALGAPSVLGTGIVAEGVLLGFHYAFSTWPFRKIYMESTEHSYRAFRRGVGRFFAEEGRLRQHVFWNGQFLDVLLLAVYRATWVSEAPSFLEHWRPLAAEGRTARAKTRPTVEDHEEIREAPLQDGSRSRYQISADG